jgi:hypothetical protein
MLADALGSTLALAGTGGTAATQYTFDPFGGTSASDAMNTNASQFTGRENDGTGLYCIGRGIIAKDRSAA